MGSERLSAQGGGGTVLPEIEGVSGAASALTIEEAVISVNPATLSHVVDVESANRHSLSTKTQVGGTFAGYEDESANGAVWFRTFAQSRPLSASLALFYNNQLDRVEDTGGFDRTRSELIVTPSIAATIWEGTIPFVGITSDISIGGSISLDAMPAFDRVVGGDSDSSDYVPETVVDNASLGFLVALLNSTATNKPLISIGGSLSNYGRYLSEDEEIERGFGQGQLGLALQTRPTLLIRGITWFPGFVVSLASNRDFTREMSFPETIRAGIGLTYNFGDILFGFIHTGESEDGIHRYTPVSLSLEGRAKHLPKVGMPAVIQQHLSFKMSFSDSRFASETTPLFSFQLIIGN